MTQSEPSQEQIANLEWAIQRRACGSIFFFFVPFSFLFFTYDCYAAEFCRPAVGVLQTRSHESRVSCWTLSCTRVSRVGRVMSVSDS